MIYLNIGTLIGESFGMSIKICTIYFEGKYTPDYVEKLYNSLKRNCTIPFEFICYSDNPNVKADIVIPLPKHTDIKLHWHKINFFSPLFGYQNPKNVGCEKIKNSVAKSHGTDATEATACAPFGVSSMLTLLHAYFTAL